MTINFSQLSQTRENSTSPVSLFSMDTSMRQAQLYIKIANVSTQAAHVRLYHDDDGSTYDESTAIVWDLRITPGEFLEVDHLFLYDNTGNVAYRSSVANALTATVYGIIDYL